MNRELHLNKFSILVCSFDKVSDILELWDNKFFNSSFNISGDLSIFYGLNFYNKQTQNLLLNKNILYSQTLDWSLSLQSWVNQIKTKYILLLLDDQVIQNFSFPKVIKIIGDIDKSKIMYAPISYGTHLTRRLINKNMIIKTKVPRSKYSINLQPSIWDKEFLMRLLLESNNPWDFEINSSKKYNRKNFNAFFYIAKDLIFYEQYVERGKIYPNRFHEIFKKPYKKLIRRDKVSNFRRLLSHWGYIYKVIKEFLYSLKYFIQFKMHFI